MCLPKAHLAALGSSALPGRGPVTEGAASDARASRLRRPISLPLTIQVQLDLLIRRLAREYQADAEDVRVLTTLVDNMKKTRK